jgi:MFS family permease
VLVPLLAADTLHVGPEGFGFLSAAFGLGALVGALAAATFRGASWRLFSIGTASFGVFALLLAPVDNAYLAGALLVCVGVSFTLFTANANSLVQLAAPDHLRGRLIGIYLFAFLGLAPLGGLFAGWLTEVGGTSLAFSVAGVVSLGAIVLANLRRQHAAQTALSHAG